MPHSTMQCTRAFLCHCNPRSLYRLACPHQMLVPIIRNAVPIPTPPQTQKRKITVGIKPPENLWSPYRGIALPHQYMLKNPQIAGNLAIFQLPEYKPRKTVERSRPADIGIEAYANARRIVCVLAGRTLNNNTGFPYLHIHMRCPRIIPSS